MITEEELRAIELRLQRTQSGPWKAYLENRDHQSGSDFIKTDGDDIELIGATAADYEFIANSYQDITKLIEAVKELFGKSKE